MFVLSDLMQSLTPLEQEFKGQLDEISGEVDNCRKALAKMEEEGRNLSISIVGAVKSGKSSLLNALLFDGKNVLPKAATPMTAALTYIKYAPDCHAEIEFFTEKEWQKMSQFAQEYERIYAEVEEKLKREDELAAKRGERRREITKGRIHSRGQLTEEYIAAKELVDSVRVSGLDVSKYLRKCDAEVVSIRATTPEELVGKLQEYVGADGKYTPIVCASSIFLNDPSLKGYEIVDTPGTNDPVIFRGARTSASLGCTDAVLAVSPASQFFQQSDLQLLSELLPRKGVKNFVLVASQYDRTVGEIEDEISGDLDPEERIVQAAMRVEDQLTNGYHKQISDIASAAQKGNGDSERWDKLVKATPICVSALAYSIGLHWDNLSDAEKTDLVSLNKLIPGFHFTDGSTLIQFSRIKAVQEELSDIKSRKQEIISAGMKEKEQGFRASIGALLDALKDRLSARIATLESGDLQTLKKRFKEQSAALKSSEATIRSVFDDAKDEAHQMFVNALNELRSAKNEYSKLSVRTETETRESRHDRGAGFLWHRSICGTRYETRTRVVRTRYANTYDAVNQVEAYVEAARKELDDTIARSTDRKRLRMVLSETVLSALEKCSRESETDLSLVKAQLQSALSKIEIPDSDFGALDYTRTITDAFESGEVKNKDVDALQNCQRDALTKVLSDLEKQVVAKRREIENGIDHAGESFVSQLIEELGCDMAKDAEDLKDKEKSLKRLKSYLPIVDTAIVQLRK